MSGPLVAAHEFFRRGEANAEGWSMLIGRDRFVLLGVVAFLCLAVLGAVRRPR